MNPEENNPLTSSGPSSFGTGGLSSNTGMGSNGSLSMADSLASAEDNLTSAGLAAGGHSNAVNLTQLGDSGTAPKSPFAPSDDPITPAAPVPGSIGSAASGPSTNAVPTSDTATGTTTGAPSAMPGATTTQPYNPFASQTATSATNPNLGVNPAPSLGATTPASAMPSSTTNTTTPTQNPAFGASSAPINPFSGRKTTGAMPAPAVNPAFQPVPKPGQKLPKAAGTKKSSNILTILLGGLAAIGIIAAVVFAVLYFNEAAKKDKVVYVPAVSDDQSNERVETLVCLRDRDFGFLLGEGRTANGTEELTVTYVGDKVNSAELLTSVYLESSEDAAQASAQLKANQAGFLSNINGVESAYNVGNTMLTASFGIPNGEVNDTNIVTMLYGTDSGDTATSVDLQSVDDHYTADGYSCTIE